VLTPHLAFRDGTAWLESVRLEDVARHFGTPTYVYSRQAIVDNFRCYRDAFAPLRPLICYAVKANSSLSVLSLLAREGAGFDIVSGGELSRVIAAGGDPGRVIFSGVGKSVQEIDFALRQGIHCFNIESEPELERVHARARLLGTRARISLRVNPDVDAKTHPYISTGLKSNKFGVPHADAERLYMRAAAMNGIEILGIECHIGSQIIQLGPYIDALDRLLELVERLSDRGIILEHLDLGGGRGISYGGEEPVPMQEFADAVMQRLGGRDLRLLLEPGRSIVGNAGLLLTRVEYLKPGEARNFAIVDAAMNDLIRPTLYDAEHPLIAVTPRTGSPIHYDVVGPVCESGDWLARARDLIVEEGDLLAILCAGAYGMTMASNYNTRGRPCEVLIDRAETLLIRERERFEHQIALEHIVV